MKFITCSLYTFLLLVVSIVAGCSGSYIKTRTITPETAYQDAIEKAKNDNRSFILHSGINHYSITHVQLDKATESLTVQLNKVDSLNVLQMQAVEGKKIKYKKGTTPIINEIHLYSKDSISYTLDEPHTIPINKLSSVDLVGK